MEGGSGDDFGRLDTAAASRSSLRTCTKKREKEKEREEGAQGQQFDSMEAEFSLVRGFPCKSCTHRVCRASQTE